MARLVASDVSRLRSSASTVPSPPTRTEPNGSSPASIASAASSRQRRRCCRSSSVTMGPNVPSHLHKHYVGEVDLNDVRAARKLLEGVTEVTPDGALALAELPDVDAGLSQGREPPAHRLVQDPRGVRPHLAAQRGGAFARRRRGERRQPRAGCRAGGVAARDQGDDLHAGRRGAAQGRGDRGLWRRHPVPRLRRDRGARRRAGVRRAYGRRADPPVRPRGHHRRAGDGRPRDPRAVPRRQDDPGAAGRRGSGRRHRAAAHRAARPADRRRAGQGRRGLSGVARGRQAGDVADGHHDGRRHLGRAARRHPLRHPRVAVRRGAHGQRGVDEQRADLAARARQAARRARRRGGGGRDPRAARMRSRVRSSRCCRAATSMRWCCST